MTVEPRIDSADIQQALRAILASQTFSRSERLRSFLKFVVEMEQLGRGHQLKGYTIGIDVFSRDVAFDPGTDPLVRVQAGKLRRLLNQFYADEGRSQQLRIRIPLGGYVPVYEHAASSRRNVDDASIAQEHAAAPGLHTLAARPNAKMDVIRELPRLFFEIDPDCDWRGTIFCNALRLWADRLWGVSLAPIGDRPEQTSRSELLFVIAVATDARDDALRLSLRHVASGRTVVDERHPASLSGDVVKLGALANQYTGATLTLPGHLYQFCHTSGLSSPLMLCLDATYRYALQRTDDAYHLARSHQQRWIGLHDQKDIVTEIPKLLALTAFHG